MLRSLAQRGVSKHGPQPSFETRPLGAPQDEACDSSRSLLDDQRCAGQAVALSACDLAAFQPAAAQCYGLDAKVLPKRQPDGLHITGAFVQLTFTRRFVLAAALR